MRSTSLSRSTPSSGSSEGASSLITSLAAESPGVFAETVLLPPLARVSSGSLRRWVPATPTNPRSRGRLVQPCGCTPTDRVYLPRLISCRGSASHVSDRIVLGLPTFRGFSPPSPPDPLGSCCPPCRFPPCGAAAPRIRAIGDITPCGARATFRTGAFSDDDVVHVAKGSLLSWLFPPFEVTFRPRPALLPDSSPGLCRASAPSNPLAVRREPQRTCALQSVREPEV